MVLLRTAAGRLRVRLLFLVRRGVVDSQADQQLLAEVEALLVFLLVERVVQALERGQVGQLLEVRLSDAEVAENDFCLEQAFLNLTHPEFVEGKEPRSGPSCFELDRVGAVQLLFAGQVEHFDGLVSVGLPCRTPT